MRNWKLAVVCLATLPVQSFAGMPIVNLKMLNSAQVKSPAAYTTDELANDPLIIQSLNMSDEAKQRLLQEIVDRGQEDQDFEEDDSEQGLIHKVQLFNNSGNLFSPRYSQPQANPYAVYDDQGQLVDAPKNCPIRKTPVTLPVPKYEPNIAFNQNDMLNPEDWKVKYFDVVVVINKHPDVQRMRVWRKVNRGRLELPQLAVGVQGDERSGWKVSTGREDTEVSNCDRKALNMPLSGHAPKKSYFSQTPTGYYTPEWLHIDHVSGDWEGSAMDHAVFFDLNRGIATHKVPNGAEAMLGKKASGACVRMDQKQAGTLFWWIRASGGPISQTEIQQKPIHCDKDFSDKVEACEDLKGQPGYKKCMSAGAAQLKADCISANAARKKPNFLTESRAAEVAGLAPYDDQPMIPYFTREGQLMTDYVDEMGVKGLYWRRAVAKTLYIVENRYVEKKVEPKVVKPKTQKPLVSQAPQAAKPIVLRPVSAQAPAARR